MSKQARIVLAGALLLASADALALFGNQDLERRVAQLEQRLGGANQTDLVIQVEQLRAEVQQLRGELEIQQHALDALRRRQQDLFSQPGQGTPGLAPAPVEPAQDLTPRAAETPAWAPPQPSGPVTQAQTADPHQEAAYKTAFEQLKSGQYKKAIESFRSFITAYPSGAYADNAQYWLGEAYYVQRQYDQAQGEFDKVVQRYPHSPKVADALLKMAYIESDRANGQKAQQLLDRLIGQYPDSTAAGLGKKQLERLRAQGN
ncbi:MAG: tol-pal system protein YbgF [Gammaproteobacteria bacterium SHHR-1]